MSSERVTLVIDQARRLIRIIFKGPLTDALLLEGSRLMRSSPEFQSGFGTLIDVTGSTTINITTELLVALAEAAQKDKNRIAILAHDVTLFGMGRMYEIIS